VTKVGAEQNVFTDCARRRRGDSAMDGGSIPPISTIGGLLETTPAAELAKSELQTAVATVEFERPPGRAAFRVGAVFVANAAV